MVASFSAEDGGKGGNVREGKERKGRRTKKVGSKKRNQVGCYE